MMIILLISRPSLPPLLSTFFWRRLTLLIIPYLSLQLSRRFSLMLNANPTPVTISHVLEKIVLKPLSEEEIILMKSLRTHDSSLSISSKIDSLLDEFADEVTLLKSIPPGIDETDCYFEEDIRLIEKLLYDNSSPRPPKEFVSANYDAASESFSPSPILVKDTDSNSSLSFAEKESFHFDIPSFSRPPTKPPDGNTGILNIKMMGDIYDQKAFMHKLMITLAFSV
uniref:Reverse transcriptase domain-containing protein n=1 Tax=Tanacetum cinerariifolium TaxID=118510 RepID=A0A699RGD9_TANCI|nr:hypothetical protein [Tanacetum cinerariifolium]